MADQDETIGKRLARAREARGLSQPELAGMVGMTQQAISAIEADKSQRPRKLRELARATGVSEEFLLGEPSVIPVEVAEQVSGSWGEEDHPAFHHGRYRSRLAGAIPEIDGATGGGEGTDGEIVTFAIGPETYSAHRVVEEWVVPRSTLNEALGMTQSNAIVMRVTGDSMEPTYPAGQRVFIDTSHTRFTVDAVYIISDGESAPKIKRLQRVPFSDPSMVRIISDNPLFQTDVVPLDKLKIHGRVSGAVVVR